MPEAVRETKVVRTAVVVNRDGVFIGQLAKPKCLSLVERLGLLTCFDEESLETFATQPDSGTGLEIKLPINA